MAGSGCSASSDKIESLFDESTAEERVEVNHRNLIDKILARYSSEYAIYRELMQNSDDANSSAVFIRFLTDQNNLCHTIVFENNGIYFRQEDWSRLKSVADGNPDEQKIGAFGVGFYSLFSVCEKPLVLSGTQCMNIYFRGNSLFVRQANLLEKDQKELTTTYLEMREPLKMPDFDNFSKFLGTSLGFTAKLREIIVFRNNKTILKLKKEIVKTNLLKIPSNFATSIPDGIFNLRTLEINELKLSAEEDLEKKSTINLRVVNGNLDVKLPKEIENGMERITKKKCPKKTVFSVIYGNREEYNTSKGQTIFQDLISYPNQGYIFIGFRTHQTTGCSLHMAARFMPTVERESIDFVDKYVSAWNHGLLSVGGLLCRIIYENEIQEIKEKFEEIFGNVMEAEKMVIFNGTVDDRVDNQDWKSLEDCTLHTASSLSFRQSTPNPIVSQSQDAYFRGATNIPLLIMTSQGFVSLADARAFDDNARRFLQKIPMISRKMETWLGNDLVKWKGSNLREVSIEDIQRDMWNRVLTDEEMTYFLNWFIAYNSKSQINQTDRDNLMSMVTIKKTSVSLSQIRYWLDPTIIPQELCFLKTVLPYEISKSTCNEYLSRYFKWQRLSLFDWTKIIVTNPELETNPEFAKKILTVVSRGLLKEKEHQDQIIALFAVKKCMPTDRGMRLPCQAYTSRVELFDDLPVIDLEPVTIENTLLTTALKVRTTVDPQLVVDRLKTDGNWSHIDMIKYLIRQRVALNIEDINFLKQKPMFPKEGDEPEVSEDGDIIRYKATELYVPDDNTFRRLRLPILDYKENFSKESAEGKFLIDSLGLQTFPPLDTILALATDSSNPDVQASAMDFFIDNLGHYKRLGYSPSVDIAFIPCADPNTLATPSDCFSNEACAILGFNVLHPNYWIHAAAIGVSEHPTIKRILEKFLNNMQRDSSNAVKMFEYLALRQGDFTLNDWNILRNSNFIPIQDKNITERINLTKSSECFLKSQEPIPDQEIYMKLFPYIDFDSDAANDFLRASGVRTRPETIDITRMIVGNAEHAYTICGFEKYLSMLRKIAVHHDIIKQQDPLLFNEMKSSKFLIGLKNERPSTIANHYKGHYSLERPEDIYINDDSIANQIFAPPTAPIEPLLEEFYEKLGSSRLSMQVEVSHQYLGNPEQTRISQEVKQRINERAAIIIHEFMQNSSQQKRELLHDKAWLEENLSVLQTNNIIINRKFKSKTDSKLLTAFIDIEKGTIYISDGELDYYSIATCLCQILFGRLDRSDSFLMEVYMTASMESLHNKPYLAAFVHFQLYKNLLSNQPRNKFNCFGLTLV